MLPPEPRLPLARGLIARRQYFVVHAPRQTGKTTSLRTLAYKLSGEGKYCAVHFSCETGEPAGDNYEAAQAYVLHAIRTEAEVMGLSAELLPPDPWPQAPDGRHLLEALRAWAQRCPLPLVLFFDEIDALRGESLRSVLRQLRDGYQVRPGAFPASVVLCGLRDVRDYRAAGGGDPNRLGTASPFNIKVTSFRLGDFTEDDLRDLYAQHTADTGQPFTEAALARAWEYSQGQPWLTNAIAREIIDEMGIEAPTPITADNVDEAKERLILARATHLDSLVAKLQEPRVYRVIAPMLAGELPNTDLTYNDDVAYLKDLGLLAISRGGARIANPIYQEVISRVLADAPESVLVDVDPRSFVRPDNRLDLDKILAEFAGFWRQEGELISVGDAYHEIAPHLVLMAWLQRVVNGGGYITREFGIGRRRIDILIRWPYTDADGKRAEQREAIELKVWHPGKADPLDQGLTQLDAYLDRLELDHGNLIIFDRRQDIAPLDQRVHFEQTKTPSGRMVTLLRA